MGRNVAAPVCQTRTCYKNAAVRNGWVAGVSADNRTGEAAMILDRFRLDDKVAVITGGGRGLGAAIALAFAEAGADVVIGSRTQSQLDEVAEQIEAVGRKA